MILSPSVLALLLSSLLISLMVLYSAGCGVQILRRWDISSGSELQLALERKTYLISTILSYFLGFQLISLFLFVYTADSLCSLFVGAMCAVGSLTVNAFGYPTLLLKLLNFLLAGLWLVLNHADSRGYDYPLIRTKYGLLLLLAPLIVAETVVQGLYFAGLRPDIITSCCGSLFSPAARGLATELATLPARPTMLAHGSLLLLTLLIGGWFLRSGRGGGLFALLSGGCFVVSLAAVVAYVSLYIYELPTHHCPFCILQREYGYLGYPLYGALLVGAVAGLGVGVLAAFRRVASLAEALPRLQRRLAATALLAWLTVGLISLLAVLRSGLRLEG
jgi:hypothetical protein